MLRTSSGWHIYQVTKVGKRAGGRFEQILGGPTSRRSPARGPARGPARAASDDLRRVVAVEVHDDGLAHQDGAAQGVAAQVEFESKR